MPDTGFISLRGVSVHNLKSVDLDLPRQKLIVFCGLSGSGKSSLALDTLYAEGQRRYIESFSAYTRQFLQRLEKPEAESIEGIPPAIAVTSKNGNHSSRSTVGTATETNDYLRLLFAKIGRVFCRGCGAEVRCDTPQSASEALAALPPGAKFMIASRLERPEDEAERDSLCAGLKEDGFIRLIVDGRTVSLAEVSPETLGFGATTSTNGEGKNGNGWYVVLDRLSAGATAGGRLRESVEAAFAKGRGRCFAFVENGDSKSEENGDGERGSPVMIDDRLWRRYGFSSQYRCEDCEIDYAAPEPRLFSFNSPLGACPVCEGFGNVIDMDLDLIVPDANKSLKEGAIAPWNAPSFEGELQTLLKAAKQFDLPTDVPFKQLEPRHVEMIVGGVPESEYGGLNGFFESLEKRKYKMHVRVFLSRWRSYRRCEKCGGTRLRDEGLAVRVGGKNVGEISELKVSEAAAFFRDLQLTEKERRIGRMMLEQVRSRLHYLEEVGLGYLTLERPLRTLSGGEGRRVALTAALGSSLVNMLYVLDEPSIGLHPRDTSQLIHSIKKLRDRGNSVVVVEHEEAMIRAADQVVEIGPGAGDRGGKVTFQGAPAEMLDSADCMTGDYMAGRRGVTQIGRRRPPNHGWIRLAGARGNNLKNVTVEFPLGVLCLVTGVSGSGKSTLVEDTLYPALCRRLRKDAPKPYPHDDIFGDGQINDVIMIDQSPIGRTPRSNPVTYLKIFDEIRNVFADTVEAKTRGFNASHFSFNVEGGRCETCNGDGYIQIDMQFLADVYMKCSQCGGARYRDEILDVTYRGRNIAEALEMTVREAFTFFRGQPKVQAKLKRLIDVGLDYVRLGQPANTLSGGEAQRLKLANYMSAAKRGRCLFILDEPTTGLHFSDVVQLLDCFEALLDVGHSLIVVEHNLQMMKAADYIIDLGPDAAENGGQLVAKGTPEMVANNSQSATGRFLAEALKERAE